MAQGLAGHLSQGGEQGAVLQILDQKGVLCPCIGWGFGQRGKGGLTLGSDLEEKLVVADHGEEYLVAVEAILPKHFFGADGPSLLELFGDIVYKIRMGCHIVSSFCCLGCGMFG